MSVDVSEDGADRTYYDGYDDGYGGFVKKCHEPDYLEGYYDCVQDSGNGRTAADFDFDDNAYWD
jgi:hypothetical protein